MRYDGTEYMVADAMAGGLGVMRAPSFTPQAQFVAKVGSRPFIVSQQAQLVECSVFDHHVRLVVRGGYAPGK